jgi:class 3 adenylate cyclase/tetratricopeptide (TPR) repeat protein
VGNRGTHAAGEAAPRTAETLVPYLPRVSLEWLRAAPEARHRALDGTLAFVDVSGFTAMSERLAPLGARGAEEVTDVMSGTFTRLLAVAYANGGGLVKFGGDALLLFFEGDAHAARACNAAHGMRSTLDQLGALDTSAGAVTLRMHVGIHTGTFDFFLAGASHRELIIAGPAAAHTVAMEDAAEAGEIVVSTDTAALLNAEELGDAKGDGFLLRASPRTAAHGVAALPDVDGIDLLTCIPVALREHLTAEKVESEHRHAAVAFVRFSGIEDLLQLEGAAAAAAAVDEAVGALQTAADAHGVCFLESDIDAAGGRVVLVAGVPTTAGDDEERLLRTARTAVDAHTRLPFHIGLAEGSVFAGRIGPPYRRTYTILGGTAALAARLMAKAPERSVWTTPELVARSRTAFEITPLEPLALKGKAAPVDAVSVGAVGAARATTSNKLPLVDRQREMPVLDAVLVPAKMGFGSVVELVGPAGIGKSRIVEEICDRAGGLPVAATACEQYESTTPYFAFNRLLRSLLPVELDGDAEHNSIELSDAVEAIAPDLVQWAPLLGDVLDAAVLSTAQVDELQPSFRRARLNGVVEELLTHLLDTPTLVHFEDAHWMDEASSDLLRHLGSKVISKPWLVCVTRRPAEAGFVAAEGVPPVPAVTLLLDPLPDEDAKALAVSAAGDALAPEDLEAITERSGGNPLFVRELVAATHAEGRDVETMPESVLEVVTTRIDSLAPGDRALLRWASVLGGTFSGELVAQVLAGDPEAALDSESWDRLGEFVERDPQAAGMFRFRHALIRDAAYEGLSFRRRRELHARVAEVLLRDTPETADIAELLSLHYMLADEPAETWLYSVLAGERAKAKFANVDAAEFLRRALAAAQSLPSLSPAEVGRTWESLGDLLMLSADYAEAHDAYAHARKLVRGDANAVAGLCLKEGLVREGEGHYSDALRWFARGLRSLETLDDAAPIENRLRLSLGYAGVRFRQGALADCVQWCERTIEEARGAGELEQLAHAYYLLHIALTSLGSPDRTRVRDLALPIYEELGDLLGQANALNNLGIDAYYEGRWDDALACYERSARARERIGDVVGAATCSNNIAEILSDQGLYAEAEALLEQADDTCRAVGATLLAAVIQGNLGRLASRKGEHDVARRELEASLAAFRTIDAAAFVLEIQARLAEAAVLAGDHEQALRDADVAELTTEIAAAPPLQAMLHRVRGYAHLQAGRHEDAARNFAQSLDAARGGDALYEVALSLRAMSRLTGDAADAAEAQRLLEALHVVRVPDVPV